MHGGMKINVANSGVMHIRNKKAKRCEMAYEVDGKLIPMVSLYNYLGSVVDEHLVLTDRDGGGEGRSWEKSPKSLFSEVSSRD